MAENRAAHGLLQPVQAAYVVAVAMSYQYRRNPRAAKLGVVIQDLPGPRAVGLSGIDQHHVVIGVAYKVYLGASRVHRPESALVFLDVGAVYVLGYLHIGPRTGASPACGHGSPACFPA